MPRIRLHDLPHTSATVALLEAGVAPKVVSERLEHSSIAITCDVCEHVPETMHEEAARAIGSLLGP